MSPKKFFSKLLLFGEYGILKNSKAITIPYRSFFGSLKIGDLVDNNKKQSNESIKDLYNYLIKSYQRKNFDYNRFFEDIENGLFFESSIPIGYGIGSSGALVAAVYEKYFLHKTSNLLTANSDKLVDLKKELSEIESFYHGKSSGLDPLNCMVGAPLFVDSDGTIKIISLPKQNLNSNRGIFIIDSGQSSKTDDLIKIFYENLKDGNFNQIFHSEFISSTNYCADSIVNYEFDSFKKNFRTLSKFVYHKLTPMISKNSLHLWKRGLDSNLYFLKLCGSGGGGFLIGFSDDLEKAKKELINHEFETLIKF